MGKVLTVTKEGAGCDACGSDCETFIIEIGHPFMYYLCRSCTRELAFRMLEATGTVDACKLCGETVIEE